MSFLKRRFLGLCLVSVATAGAQSTYQEAPTLAEQVAAGRLPPVEDRLPNEPLVTETVEATGTYGGVLRRGFKGPSDYNNYVLFTNDALVRFSSEGADVEPRLVASWETSEDFSTWTLNLREGVKWSDGEPFTSEDIMFWYDDVLLNKDLTPTSPDWISNDDGSAATFAAPDALTVTVTFSEPNTVFLGDLAQQDGADRGLAPFLPKHYLTQFHTAYAPEAELNQKTSAAGFTNWTELFVSRATAGDNPARPTTAAWVATTSVADPEFILERNPYYFAVDPEGNQLPYIDEIRYKLYTDDESLLLAALSGEIDMQQRSLSLTNYPLLFESQEAGGYRVLTWAAAGDTRAVYLNMTYEGNPEITEFFRNKEFRTALSLAVNRDEINEALYLGLAESRQVSPPPDHPYYPGDEVVSTATDFDPDRANEILDGLGLDKRNAQGTRLLPGGTPLIIEIGTLDEPTTDEAQLVANDWSALGVQTDVVLRERSQHTQLRSTNELMSEIWADDTSIFIFSGVPKVDPRSLPGTTFGPLYETWYASGGERGVEPTSEVKRVVELIDEGKVADAERQAELAREVYTLWDENVLAIGLVGLYPRGVLVVDENLANVPEQALNSWPLRTPANARPEQFFYR